MIVCGLSILNNETTRNAAWLTSRLVARYGNRIGGFYLFDDATVTDGKIDTFAGRVGGTATTRATKCDAITINGRRFASNTQTTNLVGFTATAVATCKTCIFVCTLSGLPFPGYNTIGCFDGLGVGVAGQQSTSNYYTGWTGVSYYRNGVTNTAATTDLSVVEATHVDYAGSEIVIGGGIAANGAARNHRGAIGAALFLTTHTSDERTATTDDLKRYFRI